MMRIDPRTKIVTAAAVSIAAFRADPLFLAIVNLMMAAVIVLGRVSPGAVYRSCKPAMPFILFVFLLHLLFSPGRPLIPFSLGPLKVSAYGLVLGGLLSWRFATLLFVGALLTTSTPPMDLTRGLEKLLRPVSMVGVSHHDLALTLSLALRFIPTIRGEAAILRDAQSARGAILDAGSPIRRLIAVSSLAVPLCLAVFRRGDELVTAMEARGYDGGPRTGLTELHLSLPDVIVMAGAIAMVIGVSLF
jgi:energy-coupling factor transporter transmembrane protein EcfT